MRAIIEGFPFKWQIDIVKELDVEPVYWCCNDLGLSEYLPEKCLFHSSENIISGIIPNNILEIFGTNGNIDYISDDILRADADQIDAITRIIRIRKDLYGKALAFDEGALRRFVYKQISFWMTVIDKTSPEVVLFEAAPHLVHHYALYYAARKKGIRTVIVNRVGEPIRFFLAERIEELIPDKIVNEPAFVDKVIPIRQKPKYATEGPSATASEGVSLKKIIFNLNRLWRIQSYRFVFGRIKNVAYKIPYNIIYRFLSIDTIPKHKFVYFPLHESPEDTTYPGGWNFEDQVYAIEYLSQILPEDVNIVVKEHQNQRFWRGRNLAFYPNISKLRNVSLISKNTDSFKLIDKSIAVATITGQAGWEAITNSKPVIYFGQAWYKGVPGSVYINEFKAMTLEARKDFLNTQSFSELQAWYISFYKRSFPGYVNNIMIGSELPNISHITMCINKYLSNEKVENIDFPF